MKFNKISFLFLFCAVLSTVSTSCLANLGHDLSDGEHVLLMRHADAPGYGDPPGYQLEKCSTQRNLGEKGRQQAILIGQWLTKQGIQSAHLLSSPWCRCLDTARLLDKGTVHVSPALGSFFDDMSLEKQQTIALEKLIQTQLRKSSNIPLILITHHVNIQAYTGEVINVGDMILVKVDKYGRKVTHTLFPSPQ